MVVNMLGWSREEIQAYIAHVRNEVRAGDLKPYYRGKVVFGRKPNHTP